MYSHKAISNSQFLQIDDKNNRQENQKTELIGKTGQTRRLGARLGKNTTSIRRPAGRLVVSEPTFSFLGTEKMDGSVKGGE